MFIALIRNWSTRSQTEGKYQCQGGGLETNINSFSIQIIRRVDTRIPKPLLSGSVNTSNASSSKLMTAAPSAPRAQPSAPTTSARGWTSVVASAGAPALRSSTWGARGSGSQTPSTPPLIVASNHTTRLALSRKSTPSQTEEGVPDNWEND